MPASSLRILDLLHKLLVIHGTEQVVVDDIFIPDIITWTIMRLIELGRMLFVPIKHALSLDYLVSAHIIAAAGVFLIHRIAGCFLAPFPENPPDNTSKNGNTNPAENSLLILYNPVKHNLYLLFRITLFNQNSFSRYLPPAYPESPPE
ncbi:MAG: hypothetical protein D3921_07815 [Candidatus Electrothrix sp. AW1]|nr:hypothetical protein [Candidatus Electrothrix sp. AX1]MCI5182408.1 hypothetical protein [Candidatus Electrothrix gigas]